MYINQNRIAFICLLAIFAQVLLLYLQDTFRVRNAGRGYRRCKRRINRMTVRVRCFSCKCEVLNLD